MQHQSRFFILTTMSKSGNLASLEEFSCVCLLRHHLLPIISPQAWEWRKHSRYSCWNKCLDDISIVVALAFIIKSLVVTFLFNDPMMHKVAVWWFSFKDFFRSNFIHVKKASKEPCALCNSGSYDIACFCMPFLSGSSVCTQFFNWMPRLETFKATRGITLCVYLLLLTLLHVTFGFSDKKVLVIR